MNDPTHVDVVIPVCKTLPYLDDLFNSIRMMDLTDVCAHFIFVIDFANDEQSRLEYEYVCNAVLSMPKRSWNFVVRRLNENAGLGEARNIGISLGNSPLVCWFDSDDIFTTNSIVDRVGFMKARPDVGCAYGTYGTFSGAFDPNGVFGDPHIKPFDYANLFTENQFHPCSTIIRRELFEPFDRDIKVAEDYAWALWIARKIKFAYIENVRVLYYRLRDDSLSTHSEPQKMHYPNIIKVKRAIWKIMTPEEKKSYEIR